MIQIRKSFFETNSSSTHSLIINLETDCRLPSTIDLSADDSIGDVIRGFVRNLNEEDTRRFVNWLYCNGVKTIKYYGSNKWINKFAEEYKDSYTDMGLLETHSRFTTGALINLLVGEYDEYIGRDDYMDYDYNTQLEYEL